MTERLSFYIVAYWHSIIAWIPVLITAIVAAVIICLIIYITRKSVDRQWINEPEKLDKVAKVKLKCYTDYIAKMEKLLETMKRENDELRAAVKVAIEHVRQTENIFREVL